jgi:hypothetical protein
VVCTLHMISNPPSSSSSSSDSQSFSFPLSCERKERDKQELLTHQRPHTVRRRDVGGALRDGGASAARFRPRGSRGAGSPC